MNLFIRFLLLVTALASLNLSANPEIPSLIELGLNSLSKEHTRAIAQAKKIDIPSLKEATHLEISNFFSEKSPQSLLIKNKKNLTLFRSQLTTKDSSPSNGLPWVKIKWMKNDKIIQSIWLMESGEWGFSRKGPSRTIGKNSQLPKILKEKIAENKEE